MPTTTRSRAAIPFAVGSSALALLLASCASSQDQEDASPSASETTSSAAVEEAAATPRLALTYDGGIQILDATTLEAVADLPLQGFNRLNPAGDERHAFVSVSGGFQVLDLGTWAEPHGDHSHYYTSEPTLTQVGFPAEVPGHVVVHGGRTVLFDDGTGTVTVLDTASVTEAEPLATYTTPTPHHGVAVQLSDDSLVVTEGTEDARTGIRLLDADLEEVAASDDCPGVHGETVAAHESVVVGCEDGALVLHDGEIVKVDSPDEYGRIGNLRGTEDSDIVLGDYGTDPEGGGLTQIALIDIHDGSMQLVDLGTEYTFRSLARDDDGHALVLGADGAIHVIDPETAEIERTIPVIDAWEVPEDWQQPRPTLLMLDGSAYVTDPANERIVAVDIETGEIWNEATLEVAPNELVGVSGDVVDGVSQVHDDHDGDEHEH